MDNFDSKKYLSVSDFTRLVKGYLEDIFPELYLRGEISNFRPSTSGHWYFSLKDANSSIKAIIFKNSQTSILNNLKINNSSGLENGQEVLVEGRISVYEKTGEYSIIINKIFPIGIGELTVKFELLKEKLSKEGLFDQVYKKELPKYPETIGIVTSPTGAALQDILNVLNRRFTTVKIIVFPASVQGDGAKNEVVQAIKCADHHFINNTDKKVDVLIVARGGGSIEDLWTFNEEIVARTIFNAKIPIITGIGHEIDFTIADFVSDLRAPTPSAAAEIVVKNREDLINSIASTKLRIEIAFDNYYEKNIVRFENNNSEKLIGLFTRIYENKLQSFSYFNEKTRNYFEQYYNNKKQKFLFYIDKLNNLSPLNILKRGYSLTTDKKLNIIKSYKQAKTSDKLDVIFSDGKILVTVDEIIQKEFSEMSNS